MNFKVESENLNHEVDAMTAAVKKENLLERLNRRNKDRQNNLDVKVEQRNKEQLKLEGVDYFTQTFSDRVREIEERIQNISEAATKNAIGDAPMTNAELSHQFANITMEIQELQQYLTTSTMFLTDYKIKACQNILNELNNNCEETRLKIMPKKKFGFSGKKIASKPVVNPKLGIRSTDTVDADAGETSLSNKKTCSGFKWTLSNRKDEYICLRGDEVNGQDVTISNLENCFVELQGHAGSVQITNATNCTFLCGPIARSLFAEYCENNTFALACQQLRLHSSSTCRIYLHVTCRAIIEDCKKIEIATFNYEYPSIENDFQLAGLDKKQNNYTDVADFNWLSPDVPSPNWKLLKDYEEPNWNDLRENFKAKLINVNTNL